MKIQFTILIIVLSFFQSQGQESLSAFKEALIGTWVLTKTVVEDRGGGGSYAPTSKNEIVIKNTGHIEFIRQDTTWTETYELTMNNDINRPGFYFNSESLSGKIIMKNHNEIGISRYFGGCGPRYYYEKK